MSLNNTTCDVTLTQSCFTTHDVDPSLALVVGLYEVDEAFGGPGIAQSDDGLVLRSVRPHHQDVGVVLPGHVGYVMLPGIVIIIIIIIIIILTKVNEDDEDEDERELSACAYAQ